MKPTLAVIATLLVLLVAQTSIAHPQTGIVVDKKGNVYFSDLEAVWKLDTSGRLSIFRAGVSGRHVHELSIDQDDNLYGADISFEAQKLVSAIWKITPGGVLTYLVSPTTNPPRGTSMWLDRDQRMYFVDQDNRSKTQTLLLRRSPDGEVTTLAGGAYGNADGKGTEAKFGSVGGLFISRESVVFLTDGTSVRKVASDGVVTTIAKDLNKRTADDRPMLFGKNDGILSGLYVDHNATIYVADAGNQRLLKIDPNGNVSVVYRGDAPYYPNGVFVTPDGHVYTLEVGFKPPGTGLPARVRKITPTGTSSIVAVAGQPQNGSATTNNHEEEAPRAVSSMWEIKYLVLIAGIAVVALSVEIWRRRQKFRRTGG